MRSFFASRRGWIAIVLFSAILVGLFHVAPQLLIKRAVEREGNVYEGLQLTLRSDMTQQYFARVREVADGHFPPADLHRRGSYPYLYPPLPPVLAAPFFLFGGPSTVLFLAEFIFPALIFLLFTALGLLATRSKLWALLLGFLGTLTPILGGLPYGFKSFDNFLNIVVKHFYPLVESTLPKLFLDRMDDPLLTLPFYIAAIGALILLWEKPSRKRAIFTGIALGVLSYVYFHYWVYLTISAGILFLIALARRKKEPERLRAFLGALGVFAIVMVPYAINYVSFTNAPGSEDFIARVQIEVGRFFRTTQEFSVLGDYLAYTLLALGVYFLFWRRGEKSRALLAWGFIGAMPIVWNVQLVTGFVPHPDHFFKAIAPVFFLILFLLLIETLRKIPPKILKTALILGIVLLVTKKTVNALEFINPPREYTDPSSKGTHTFDPNLKTALAWLDKLPGEPTVATPSFVSTFYLLSYTSARPSLFTGFNTLATNREIGERFILTNKIFGANRKTVENRLLSSSYTDLECWETCDRHSAFNRLKGAQHLFYNAFRERGDIAEYRYVSPEFANELLLEYDSRNVSWADLGAEYIFEGPWEREFGIRDLAKDPNLEKVYENQSVRIYALKK